jgi:hypothetical protein
VAAADRLWAAFRLPIRLAAVVAETWPDRVVMLIGVRLDSEVDG